MDAQTAFLIAQGISIVTGVVAIVLKQMKTMRLILLFEVIANLLASSTYLLLGGDAGAIVSVLAILHSLIMFLFNRKEKSVPIAVPIAFIVLYTACSTYSIITKADPMEVLPAIAAVCFALALTQKKPRFDRVWSVINAFSWVIYDGYNAAYVMLAVHMGILISTVVAMVRIDGILKPKKE